MRCAKDLPGRGGDVWLDCLGDFDSPREPAVEAIDDVNFFKVMERLSAVRASNSYNGRPGAAGANSDSRSEKKTLEKKQQNPRDGNKKKNKKRGKRYWGKNR